MDISETAIFEGLNPEQRRAVATTAGPVLIVAGAGSGKTRVLTCRVANILRTGVPAHRVMALTFTKKAADEMKERISAMVGAAAARGIVMGTFHSVFARFLRHYAASLGYPENFTILDQGDSLTLIKNCIKELDLDEGAYKPRKVQSRISDAKNNLRSPAAYAADAAVAEADRRSRMPRLAQLYDLYWRKCRQCGVMDFDDILFEMNVLLRDNPQALEEIPARFDHILVDEYQDTNMAQYRILKKLAATHHNICVVGDDSQSIYAFRGARIQNILSFKADYPECEIFRLERNYRSTQTIVNAANSLIEHNEGRIPKKCFSEGEKGAPLRLVKAFDDKEEAYLTVSSIVDTIRNEKAQYQDFAVLYRTNAQSRSLEESLRRRNIPYVIYSGNSFYERAEVKDLFAYIRLAVNPDDDISFLRTVNKPARGIGDTSLKALRSAALTSGISLFAACSLPEETLSASGLRPAAASRLAAFAASVMEYNASVGKSDAYTLAMEIFGRSGIKSFYESDTSVEGQSRFANVEELCNSIKEFVDKKRNEAYEDSLVESGADGSAGENSPETASEALVSLSDYLEDIALLSAVDVDDEQTSNKVALMTAHSSKGLEFPYVYIVGMEENLFPSVNSSSSLQELEEERRLFYVAMTRAGKAVTLSYCNQRMRNGNFENNAPSRFISEIDPSCIDGAVRSPIFGGAAPSRTDIARSAASPRPDMSRFRSLSSLRQNSFPHSASVQVPAGDIIPSPIMDLREGQRVCHGRFGSGTIKQMIDEQGSLKLIVDFDSMGTKTLLAQYAKLMIIGDLTV